MTSLTVLFFLPSGMVAGRMDGIDAGCMDAGCIDAGCIDAGCMDAGCIDAGCMDAGCKAEAVCSG